MVYHDGGLRLARNPPHVERSIRRNTPTLLRSIATNCELRANRNTDFTEKFFVRVGATEEFPFLVTKLSPYYDR
jgi:hypothetical protein